MNQEQTRFDSAFKTRGGINLLDDLDVKKLVDNIELILKHNFPLLPKINGGSIFDPSLNAVIKHENEEFFLGINIGCNFLIMDMFTKMFSSKTILPNIGNVNLETDDKKTINIIITDGKISLDHELAVTNITGVRDSTRNHYSNIYATWVIEFVILHEFGHIINGHLGYKMNRFNDNNWNEFNYNDEINGLETHVSQALEMDADRFAFYHSYFKAEELIKSPTSIPEPLRIIYKDARTYLIHWVFAIYSFFRLSGFKEFNSIEDGKEFHPPASIRAAMIVHVANVVYSIRQGEKKDAILGNLKNSIFEAEKAYSEVTYNENSPDKFLNNIKLSKDYVSSIYNNWGKCRKISGGI